MKVVSVQQSKKNKAPIMFDLANTAQKADDS